MEHSDSSSFDPVLGRAILQVVSVVVLALAAFETAFGIQASEHSDRVEAAASPAPRILRDFQGILQLVVCATAFFGVHRHYRARRLWSSVSHFGIAFLYVPMIPVLSMHPAWIALHAIAAITLGADFVLDVLFRRELRTADDLPPA